MLLLPCAALALIGCDPPDPDDPGAESTPDPSGVIEGTVLYVGPRPSCVWEDDQPVAVRGRVVLLLFLSDNPPPPGGSAASAENLLLVPGDEMFDPTVEDCLPREPTPEDLRQPITRSVAFTWPDVALAPVGVEGVDYQIRGFYDHDEDFNPFFSVRRLATKGDVAGGAFENAAAEPPQFERVRFGDVEDRVNGQVVEGVAVTLGAVVNTELPAFRVGEGTRALASDGTLPVASDALMREELLWSQAAMRLTLVDPLADDWRLTLAAAGMSIDPHPSGYGWFVLPVDADRDGEQELHPTLGAAGIPWEHPIVILRRARSPIELLAGVPDSVIVATVRPSQTATKTTFDPTIDVAVPPIAVVNLDPTNPACAVPYIPPGNLAETYERVPVDCQELPTGNYDVNALSGIAGGAAIDYRAFIQADMPELPDRVLDIIVRQRTDNDWIIEGGQFSSQAWSIPNELGCPDPYRPNAVDDDGDPITVSQIDPDPLASCGDDPIAACDDANTPMQCSQGPAGRFAVVDPDPSDAPSADDTSDGHGVAVCQTTTRAETMMPSAVEYMPVPEACCAPVAHLCGLPLCRLRPSAVLAGEGDVRAIREIVDPATDFRREDDGTITPLCTPFLPPASCCR